MRVGFSSQLIFRHLERSVGLCFLGQAESLLTALKIWVMGWAKEAGWFLIRWGRGST